MDKSKDDFITRLNTRLQPHERIFKVYNAKLGRNLFTITLLINAYDFDEKLDIDFRNRLTAIASEILPSDLPLLNLAFKKSFTSEEVVTRVLLKYIYDEFNMLSPKVSKDFINVKIAQNTIKIVIRIPRYIANYCESNDFLAKVKHHLEHEFMEDVECELKTDNTLVEQILDATPESTRSIVGLIEIDIKDSILPGVISKAPIFIEKAKKKAAIDIVICGKVKSITQREARATKRIFYTFILDDTTSAINVTVFPRNDADIERMQALQENSTVVALGNISFNSYEYANSMIANKLSYCDIDFEKIKTDMKFKDALDDYIAVFPEKYIEREQIELTDLIPTESKDNNEYVVFDFETTGLNISEGAEAIELGAVKIKNDKIIEQFSSFIKIDKPLSQEIINLTGITDNDLQNAPKAEDVVTDFYKFTRGCILIAHNLSFDMAFLEKYARPIGFAFDNDGIDTINLARLKVKAKDYKLNTLIEEFGIINQSAHRAIFDAIATAKLFLRLKNMVDLRN